MGNGPVVPEFHNLAEGTSSKAKNLLLTGRPGSGKSTIIREVVNDLSSQGVKVGGLHCPEIRGPLGRLGFKIVELATGEEKILAHVGHAGPRVSKYGVDLTNLGEMSRKALEVLPSVDAVVIDEIGPMEVMSPVFREFVLRALESPKPVLAAVHKKTEGGFIGGIKKRPDVAIFEVGPENRERLLVEVKERMKALLGMGGR
jgi:nucleoside-triphosphatase